MARLQLDALLGLCALTDAYKEKAQAMIAAVVGEAYTVTHVAFDMDVDWSFVDEVIYKQKTTEAARQVSFAPAAKTQDH